MTAVPLWTAHASAVALVIYACALEAVSHQLSAFSHLNADD